MPITPDTPDLDDSPWYKIMEKKGMHWNQFAVGIGESIEGSYNADLLEFKMEFQVRDVTLYIYGRRDLKSRMSLFIPRNGEIAEHLHIWFAKPTFKRENLFSIYRISFWNNVKGMFTLYALSRREGAYRIRYNSEPFLEGVLDFNVLGYNALWKVASTKHRFNLVLSYLPSEPQALNKILDFVKKMVIEK